MMVVAICVAVGVAATSTAATAQPRGDSRVSWLDTGTASYFLLAIRGDGPEFVATCPDPGHFEQTLIQMRSREYVGTFIQGMTDVTCHRHYIVLPGPRAVFAVNTTSPINAELIQKLRRLLPSSPLVAKGALNTLVAETENPRSVSFTFEGDLRWAQPKATPVAMSARNLNWESETWTGIRNDSGEPIVVGHPRREQRQKCGPPLAMLESGEQLLVSKDKDFGPPETQWYVPVFNSKGTCRWTKVTPAPG